MNKNVKLFLCIWLITFASYLCLNLISLLIRSFFRGENDIDSKKS